MLHHKKDCGFYWVLRVTVGMEARLERGNCEDKGPENKRRKNSSSLSAPGRSKVQHPRTLRRIIHDAHMGSESFLGYRRREAAMICAVLSRGPPDTSRQRCGVTVNTVSRSDVPQKITIPLFD